MSLNRGDTTKVLCALLYTNQFLYPLSIEEWFARVFWNRGNKLWPRRQRILVFAAVVRDLLAHGIVRCERFGGVSLEGVASGASHPGASQPGATPRFFLAARPDLPRAYRESLERAGDKWHEAYAFARRARAIPWVLGVGVTGAVAMNTPAPNDDVDFLIITKHKRLWLVRLLVVFLALLLRKRRSWQGEEPNSWCFNLWLDEEQLSMPTNKRSLYSAYEIAQVRFVYARDCVAQRFYARNTWVRYFLPEHQLLVGLYDRWHDGCMRGNGLKSNLKIVTSPIASMIDLIASALGVIASVFDAIAHLVQLWYMRPHRTTERVGRGHAFFHPRDTRRLLYKRTAASARLALGVYPRMGVDFQLPKYLRQELAPARRQKKQIVLVTGVFDLFHPEHQLFLDKAKKAGDYLVVALESDARTRQLKGPSRPKNNQAARWYAVQSHPSVDAAFVLPEVFHLPEHHRQLIAAIRPSVLAVSSHSPHLDKKRAILAEFSARVLVVHAHNPKISTTQLLVEAP